MIRALSTDALLQFCKLLQAGVKEREKNNIIMSRENDSETRSTRSIPRRNKYRHTSLENLQYIIICCLYVWNLHCQAFTRKKDGCISMNKLFAFNLKFVLLGGKNTSEMLHLCMLLHCRCCRSRHKLVMSNYFSTVELDLLIWKACLK